MATDLREWQAGFIDRIASLRYLETMFDRLTDIVFSIKDLDGRYVVLSEAAVARCGLSNKSQAVGLTAFDLFPEPMAQRYTRQDAQLFRSGRPIIDNLDLTLYRDHSTGWCLSTKEPLRDAGGKLIGLVCASQDLHESGRSALIDADFAETVDYMHANLGEPLRVAQLAERSGLTPPQLDRRMKKVFHLPTNQYLLKIRIDAAARMLLDASHPISLIAQQTGFCDQSGLSRCFRQLTGMSPRQYRQAVLR